MTGRRLKQYHIALSEEEMLLVLAALRGHAANPAAPRPIETGRLADAFTQLWDTGEVQ